MSKYITITIGPVRLACELNDTLTARAIWEALPVQSTVNLWGKEIYFPIPLKLELEKGQEVVQSGDLGYWPQGNAFCIFFGATPVSQKGEIRPASAVTVFGRVTGDIELCNQVTQGSIITVDRVIGEM